MVYYGMQSLAELSKRVGGLSEPSKMPCYSYSLPARACKVGSILREVKGSTCNKCYAFRGNYAWGHVQNAQWRRLGLISEPDWVSNMVAVINAKTSFAVPYFRWHDSGDIQSIEHLDKIVEIAKQLSHIKFWIPTRENGIVKQWLAAHPKGFPRNLTVRLSAAMIGEAAPRVKGTVGSSVSNPKGFQCPAKSQANHCGDCRACWNKKVKDVSYAKH